MRPTISITFISQCQRDFATVSYRVVEGSPMDASTHARQRRAIGRHFTTTLTPKSNDNTIINFNVCMYVCVDCLPVAPVIVATPANELSRMARCCKGRHQPSVCMQGRAGYRYMCVGLLLCTALLIPRPHSPQSRLALTDSPTNPGRPITTATTSASTTFSSWTSSTTGHGRGSSGR